MTVMKTDGGLPARLPSGALPDGISSAGPEVAGLEARRQAGRMPDILAEATIGR